MAYDFKKEFKALYAPSTKPSIVDVPEMTFLNLYPILQKLQHLRHTSTASCRR
jgi:hypothetical protein